MTGPMVSASHYYIGPFIKNLRRIIAVSSSMQQLSFNDPRFKKAKPHGGEHSKKLAHRIARPLTTKAPIHIVFKSTLAKGKYSFRGKNITSVDQLVQKISKKYGVNIHKYANSGNHLHMIISCKNRYRLKRWIQILPQSLMFLVTGLNKSTTLEKLIGRKYFFDYRPFTRIIQGWKNFIYCRNYVEKIFWKLKATTSSQIGFIFNLDNSNKKLYFHYRSAH